MNIKILYWIALINTFNPLHASQADTSTKPWPLQHFKQLATKIRSGQTISPIKIIVQAPHYSPWSWQHLKNLGTLAILPTPTTNALAQIHRKEFKKKMLQDEKRELEKLVDTNNPLWKNFQNFDKHYEESLKTDNPNRVYDKNLPKEWRQEAKKALRERGINPHSIHFEITSDPTALGSAGTTLDLTNPPFFFYPKLQKTESRLLFNQSIYNEKIAPLPDEIREPILSHLAQHEATHFAEKHNFKTLQIWRYHQYYGTTIPDCTAFNASQEKIADTFPALISREHAHNASIYRGYPKNMPDIEIEKSYHGIEYFHKNKQELYDKARQVQKTIQQHRLSQPFIPSNQGLYNRAINAIAAPYQWYKKYNR